MKTRTLILSGMHKNIITTGTLSVTGENSLFCKLHIYTKLEQGPIILVVMAQNQNFVGQNIGGVDDFNFVLDNVNIDSELFVGVFEEKDGECVMSNSLTQEQKQALWECFVNEKQPQAKVELQSNCQNVKKDENLINSNASFFELIENQFNELFENNSHCEEIEELIENSQWVSVNFDDNNSIPYVLGKIFDENKKLKLICYGQPSKNKNEVPDNIDLNYSQWLPIEKDGERGYFIMYQDAQTGDNFKIDD